MSLGETAVDHAGVEVGSVDAVGESPRVGDANPQLEAVEREFARKYIGDGASVAHDGKHAWLRITPERQYTWDFRKLAAL